MTALAWIALADLWVDGAPKGAPRPRFGRGRVRKSSVDAPWRAAIRRTIERVRPERPYAEPIRVELAFLLPRPKRFTRQTLSGAALLELYGGAIPDDEAVPHLTTPDVDNLSKGPLDVMAEATVGALRCYFVTDDSWVIDLETTKRYCPVGGRPGCRISIWAYRRTE